MPRRAENPAFWTAVSLFEGGQIVPVGRYSRSYFKFSR